MSNLFARKRCLKMSPENLHNYMKQCQQWRNNRMRNSDLQETKYASRSMHAAKEVMAERGIRPKRP